jgi:hypothetical protein
MGDDYSMSAEQDSYYNLAERIKDAFPEIDSDISTGLSGSDEYAALQEEMRQLQRDFPAIAKAVEGVGAISLTNHEHAALVRYLSVKSEMEDLERRQIYFRGHTDGFAYLKKIGAI